MNSKSDSSVSSSDTEDLSSDNDETDLIKNRQKRGIAWCGVEDDQPTTSTASKIIWPPKNPSSNWRQLRPVHFGNSQYGRKMQLYSKTHHHLALYPDGTVKGTGDEKDLHTYLEIVNAGHPGHVRIKGLLCNLYVAMDKKGRLHADGDAMENDTVFIESFQGSYNTYLSVKYAHLGWYIGIKKNGKFKKGSKTKYGQKSIMFLPRRSKFQ